MSQLEAVLHNMVVSQLKFKSRTLSLFTTDFKSSYDSSLNSFPMNENF